MDSLLQVSLAAILLRVFLVPSSRSCSHAVSLRRAPQGPAEAFRASGIAGADLLAWSTADEVQADLKITPFAARKVLAARDDFLAS